MKYASLIISISFTKRRGFNENIQFTSIDLKENIPILESHQRDSMPESLMLQYKRRV